MDHKIVDELVFNIYPHEKSSKIIVNITNDINSYSTLVNEDKALFKDVAFGNYTVTVITDKYENFSGNIILDKTSPTNFNINLISVKRTLH